ncbi:hypothetical protein KSS87_012662 [Heliosperma pusillum]|nr:hypothetical protein KSS87_012662 [Heliosperma pusillum]
MDSLFATYASSSDDEHDDHQPPPSQPPQQPPSSKPTTSLFSSLPNPLSSSSSSSKPSSLFSILPPPSSQITPISLPNPNPKRVVQFRPPQFNSNLPDDDDDDDEDDEETIEERERKKRRQLTHDTSVKSFLSSIPAPKNSAISSFGTAPGARRSIIDTAPTPEPVPIPIPEVGIEQNVEDGSHLYTYDPNNGYGNYEGYEQQQQQVQYYDTGNSSWSNNSDNVVSGIDSFIGMGGGRRRKDQLPPKIVEVKQDELMKNRPTEDKSKLTGMTYGPSYQPASSKGKPSKLHKRKHQIGSLYFDMRQNEPELAERRAKGFLTKAETHAKYGW